MVALVHDHHAHGVGQLVQLHAVQTLHGGNGEFGAQALALAGDHGHFPVVQTKAQLGTLLGLLGQIQRVGDPEGWPPQPGDERHADLSLAGPAGGHQHALTPFAGKGGVHGLLLVVPQGKAGLFKGAGLAPQGPVFGHGAGRALPPDFLGHAPGQREGVALDLVQHDGPGNVPGRAAQPQGVLVAGVRHGQLPDQLVQQRGGHIGEAQLSI